MLVLLCDKCAYGKHGCGFLDQTLQIKNWGSTEWVGAAMFHIGPLGRSLMGEDIWISDNGGEGSWVLLQEEGLCDQHYADPDAKTIPSYPHRHYL